MPRIKIGKRRIGDGCSTYFVADIAANHDGDLQRAIDLIHRAADAGADAAKFQHFRAPQIVSREGFEAMRSRLSHQSKWSKSVYRVYQDASVPWDWTPTLKKTCDAAGIQFLSAPYDRGAVDMLDPYVPAHKIGSGDITWIEHLEHIARKGKPVLLATGASDLRDVQRAVAAILAINRQLVLMQCNTNYTGSAENFRYIRLNVLRTYASMYPDLVLGLSDHSPGHAAVLGAVALGARMIEKHFTDDRARKGPDHPFSLDARQWKDMVERTRELENALGDGNKIVEGNEKDTVIIQRRCLRAARILGKGKPVHRGDLIPLRPAPADAIFPYDLGAVLGRKAKRTISKGDYLRWEDLA
jgi:sialic acid synthase SpsE